MITTKLPVIPVLSALFIFSPGCMNNTAPVTPTRVAIKNNNTFATTVSMKSADNVKTEVFDLATSPAGAGMTSPLREITFSSMSQISITCTNNGCNLGTLDLTASQDNTISVASGYAPAIGSLSAPKGTSGGGGAGGW